jgi:hypothetical protein
MRRLVAVAGIVMAVFGGTVLGAGPAAASQPALPSNCWWTWSNDFEAIIGVAGYCANSDGSVEWFDFDGNYGSAWWM